MKVMKKVNKPGLIILVSLFMFAAIPSYAKNLGVWGATFPVIEQDIREFIYDRLSEMERNGEMVKLKEKFIKNVKDHTLRPTPVAGLTVTKKPKTFYYDPIYILNKDIEDHEGNIIARKGTVINPLDTITLHGVLFFLDADDKRQIKWALENAKKHNYIKYILVRGNIKDAGRALNDRIYFDQSGLITKQLGIKHIPCTVKQKDKKLQIQEYALKEEENDKAE